MVIDEQCLVLNLKDKGLCIITGCYHTGVVNACQYAMQLTNCHDIYLLMGGFHLAGLNFEDRIDSTISDLSAMNPDYWVLGHCTGMQAQISLQNAFGDRHIPYSVGTTFKFATR